MTTWTLEQVHNVHRAAASGSVDRTAAASRREYTAALTCLREHLVDHLIDVTRTHAVDVHRGDVATHVADTLTVTTLTAVWAPITKQVELVGGPEDGELWEVPDVWATLLVPIHRALSMTNRALSVGDVHVPMSRYDVDGWREVERRWVFAYQGDA